MLPLYISPMDDDWIAQLRAVENGRFTLYSTNFVCSVPCKSLPVSSQAGCQIDRVSLPDSSEQLCEKSCERVAGDIKKVAYRANFTSQLN